MQRILWTLTALIAATALAGCTGPAPAQSSEVGLASGVSIASHPTAAVDPNTQQLVCWQVNGTGKVAHVAVHYGNQSHAGASTVFSDYPNAAYPNNNTAADPAGYNLPGTFCTNVAVGKDEVYFRGHVIDREGGNGKLSSESEITVKTVAATAVVAVNLRATPANAAPGSMVLACWDVQGTGTIPHTAIHTDAASHTAATSFADYKGAAYYPANHTGADAAGYALPGSFCTNVKMPDNGTLYLRAHAMVNPPGMISTPERAIAVNGTAPMSGVAATVTWMGNVPTTGTAGTDVLVCWTVTGTGKVAHTAVHSDATSHATEVGATFSTYQGTAYYPDNATSANATGYQLPGNFCTNVRLPAASQTIYLRPHVIDSTGGNGRLGPDEKAITAL